MFRVNFVLKILPTVTNIHCQWYSRQNDSRSSKVCEVWYLFTIHWFFKLQKNTDCKRSWYQHSAFVLVLSTFNDMLSTS